MRARIWRVARRKPYCDRIAFVFFVPAISLPVAATLQNYFIFQSVLIGLGFALIAGFFHDRGYINEKKQKERLKNIKKMERKMDADFER